jgi:hypothetical protein
LTQNISSQNFALFLIVFGVVARKTVLEMGGAACSMPCVSDIDDACGISTHHMFLSNCVVQVMRVWSLAAVLSLLAKYDTPRRGSAAWFRADPCGLNPAHAFS